MEVLFIYTRPCTKVCRAAGACNCCEREVRAIAHSLTHAGWPCRAAAVHQVLDGMGSSSASRQLQVVVLPVVTGGRRSLECTNGGWCPMRRCHAGRRDASLQRPTNSACMQSIDSAHARSTTTTYDTDHHSPPSQNKCTPPYGEVNLFKFN